MPVISAAASKSKRTMARLGGGEAGVRRGEEELREAVSPRYELLACASSNSRPLSSFRLRSAPQDDVAASPA